MYNSWEPELPLALDFYLVALKGAQQLDLPLLILARKIWDWNWLRMGWLFSVWLLSPLPLPCCCKAWWKGRKCSWALPATGFIYFHKGVKFSSTNHQYLRAMTKPRVGEESSLSLKALFIVKSSPQKIWCLINWSLLCFKSFLQQLQKKI